MGLCTSCTSSSSGPSSLNLISWVILLGLASCLPSVSAFGSGNIPAAAYLKGKAWRHGDIEDTLEGLAKVAGESGGAIVGAIASALLGSAAGGRGKGLFGKKFTSLDVKRIYFGNWLRDLSQVCDIAGFKAMTPESLVICIMTMGFLSFGYATREFQVTKERLGVYLLTEHIDNPKGYGEGEDPQTYDSRLRPRVDEDRELQIDQRNGMKMYIASDDQGFDTSTLCIRRVFRKCIQLGREAHKEKNQEKEHESLRLLGTGLHTLEDFSAHSNWCELALQKLGHKGVFAHVGENVKVNSPEGPVPPLVTGTFAGADFCFSMLGEAHDKISSASITDLTAQLDSAQVENNKTGGINLDFIKSLMTKLPLGGGKSQVQQDLASMEQKKHAFDLDGHIDKIAPRDLQKKIWDIFVVRDNLMRRIEELIEGIPGLGDLLENLSLSLAQWIMVTIDPFVRPILLQASTAIGQGSQAVISGNDQWTVFNDPNASDPTHSVLAKDHFSNILNDPAGNISVIIVKYTVGLIVEAWGNDENPDRVIDQILEAIHHPNYARASSSIQREMMEYMQRWLNEMDQDDRKLTLNSLTKDSVRNHRNQRRTSEGGIDPRLNNEASSHYHSHPAYQQPTKYEGSHSDFQNATTRPTSKADSNWHAHPSEYNNQSQGSAISSSYNQMILNQGQKPYIQHAYNNSSSHEEGKNVFGHHAQASETRLHSQYEPDGPNYSHNNSHPSYSYHSSQVSCKEASEYTHTQSHDTQYALSRPQDIAHSMHFSAEAEVQASHFNQDNSYQHSRYDNDESYSARPSFPQPHHTPHPSNMTNDRNNNFSLFGHKENKNTEKMSSFPEPNQGYHGGGIAHASLLSERPQENYPHYSSEYGVRDVDNGDRPSKSMFPKAHYEKPQVNLHTNIHENKYDLGGFQDSQVSESYYHNQFFEASQSSRSRQDYQQDFGRKSRSHSREKKKDRYKEKKGNFSYENSSRTDFRSRGDYELEHVDSDNEKNKKHTQNLHYKSSNRGENSSDDSSSEQHKYHKHKKSKSPKRYQGAQSGDRSNQNDLCYNRDNEEDYGMNQLNLTDERSGFDYDQCHEPY
ncbi:hypothetical protein O181_024204 [Austropuccinia psidii MF-1]|uniref:Heterokaryon incompatibility protein HET-C n=1 Tax=Austropuccinia psidii MF-1 TaxID=1389203 RepID=A0A9Q3CI71_9BASI|nr:hypothetical protein [Austropuccinia psidii MF-1]